MTNYAPQQIAGARLGVAQADHRTENRKEAQPRSTRCPASACAQYVCGLPASWPRPAFTTNCGLLLQQNGGNPLQGSRL